MCSCLLASAGSCSHPTCSPVRNLFTASSSFRRCRHFVVRVGSYEYMCRNLCEVHACTYGTRASMRVQRRNTHAALSTATPIGTRNGTSTEFVHAGITLATQTTRPDPNVCERACAASALCSQVCSTLGSPMWPCVGFFYISFVRSLLARSCMTGSHCASGSARLRSRAVTVTRLLSQICRTACRDAR